VTARVSEARERLADAQARMARRPREDTVASLARLLDDWRAPGSRWQKRLVEELPGATGFAAETVREGLARALEGWTGDALRSLVVRELGALPPASSVEGFPHTSVLLAGSIPMPTIVSLVAPLVLHSAVLAKPAARDPISARVFADSLAEVDPELAACLEVLPFASDDAETGDAFLAADCVVATGSDETIAGVAARVRAGTRLVTYGHRLSVAAVGGAALADPEVARALALDVALWDQLGCLSPVAVYCVAPDAEPFAEALAAALGEIEGRLPRGAVATDAAAALRRERDEAEMRRAGGADVSVRGDASLRWTVVRESDPTWRPAPLHRFVRVHAVASSAELRRAIAPLSRHLAAVGLAGVEPSALAASGASRLCAPGRMQTPPLDWHHDGQPLLLPLARIVDRS